MITAYDVIVVGTGLAGLFTALELSKTQKVLVLSQWDYTQTNSYLAQGGIAAAVSKEDSPTLHFEDTMRCGHYQSKEDVTWQMVKQGPERIKDLNRYGVGFDGDAAGYHLALEGAHSMPRILRRGDHTGRSTMETLIQHAKAHKNITQIENAYVFELVLGYQKQGQVACCQGVHTLIEDTCITFTAPYVVLATGGLGHLFQRTTNAKGIDGSGLALAMKANIHIQTPSLLQYHPTGLYSDDLSKPHFLISEAVRGEGAKLYSTDGYRFMVDTDPRHELAPRDVVSRAIYKQMMRTQSPYVFLDITHRSKDFLMRRFPTIYAHCKDMGFSMEKDPIPIVPCMHYFMGGIPTDHRGRTKLAGLYAVGECAYTGVHGHNRLASNSLLEALVFGYDIARDIENQKMQRCTLIQEKASLVPYFSEAQKAFLDQIDLDFAMGEKHKATQDTLKAIHKILDHPLGMREATKDDLRILHTLMLIKAMLVDKLEDKTYESL